VNEEILLNNRRSAAITGAKRRAVISIAVLVMCFSANFRFLDVFVHRLIDAWHRSEKNDVNGQYVAKKSHPLILHQQI